MKSQDAPFFLRKRYFVCFWTFIGAVGLMILRSNLSIAIVEMTSEKNFTLENGTIVKQAGAFDWDPTQKGFVISLFSYGYCFCPLGGILAVKYGGATVFGLGTAATAVLTALSPFLLRIHFILFAVARILEGVFESFAVGSFLNVFIYWAPPQERSRLTLLAYVGSYLGIFINYTLCGFIAQNWGYEAVFFSTGMLTLIWYIIWFMFVSNNPLTDRFITQKEKIYFENIVPVSNEKKKLAHAWKKILTSKAAWAYINEHFCYSWIYSFTSFCLPMYVKDIFNVEVQTVGFISGVPVVGGIIGIIVWAFIADFLRSRRILHIKTVHRLFVFIGQLSCVILLFIIGFWTNFTESIICFFLLKFLTGAADVSYIVVFIDMFGEYCSLVRGLAIIAVSIGLLLNPVVMGFLVTDHSRSSWNTYFLFISIFNIVSLIVFYKFGTSDFQDWATPTYKNEKEVETSKELTQNTQD